MILVANQLSLCFFLLTQFEGHVVTSLNKLDCADEEQMLLSSRDSKDLLVVSFTDVRRCLESSFSDLDQQANQAQQSQHTTSGKQSSTHTQGAKSQISEIYKQSAGFTGRRQQHSQQIDRNNFSSGDGSLLAVRSRNSNVLGVSGGKGRGSTSYSTSSSRPNMFSNSSLMATGEGRSSLSQRSEGQHKQGQLRGQSQGLNSYSHAQQQHLLLQQEQLKLKILQQHIQQQQQQQGGSSAASIGFRYNSEQLRHSSDSYSLLQQRQQQHQHSSSTTSAHLQQQRLEQNSLPHSSSIQQQLLQQQHQRQQHRGQALYY